MFAFHIFPRFVLALGLLVLGLMSFMLYQADTEREESHRWILHTQDVLTGLSDMKESISRIGVSQLIFLMSGDEQYIRMRNERYQRLKSEIDNIESLTVDNSSQQARIAQIKSLMDRRFALMQEGEALRRKEGIQPNQHHPFTVVGQRLTDQVLQISDALEQEEKRLLEIRNAHASQLYRTGLGGLVVIVIGSSVLIALGFHYSSRQVRARKKAETRLQLLADNIPGVLYQTEVDEDRKQTLVFASKGAHELLQRDPSSAIDSQVWLEAIEPEDRPAYLAAVEAAHQTRDVFRHQYRLRLPSGDPIWVSHQATILAQEDGSVVVNGYVFDITDEVKLKEALKEAKETADRANGAKTAFLATMSHEIRTPMNGVIGLLELLTLTQLNDDQQQMVRIVKESSESLLRLLNDILDVSKIEAGKTDIHPEPVSIRNKVEFLYHLNIGHAASKNLSLQYAVDPRISPVLMVDRHVLRQIMSNLVSNAIKFTSHGGVTITADFVGREDGIETVRLSVRDSGPGISKDDQAQLFQAYSRGTNEETRAITGTGLGLLISRRLAELMGGTIEIESAPGLGTTMSLTLPLPVASPGTLPKTERTDQSLPAKSFSTGARVLIADDHPINRVVLKRQIMALGLDVECVENGRMALEKWRRGGISLIITDCSMPEMDGYALTGAIRAAEAHTGKPRTPVIACTAHASEDTADACLAAGMDDFLTKPLELSRLREVLDLWLPRPTAPVPERPPALPGQTDNAPISRQIMRELTDDDPRVERDLTEQFRQSTAEDATALDSAIAAMDMVAISNAAHRMLGASATVGATDFADACRAMVQAARAGDAAAVQAALPRFQEERKRLQTYLDRLLESDAVSGTRQSARQASPAAALSFLIVDDHQFQRNTLRQILTQLGATRISEARDGQEALALLASPNGSVDIIISDLEMPNMDGMEFIRHLGGKRQISLILASALEPALLSSVGTMTEAYGNLLLGIVQKPITADLLESLIERHRTAPAAASVPAPAREAMPRYLLEQIIAGMDNGEFEAFLQPKVDLASGRIIGAEALARWRHPKHGIMSPASFIPQLEANGPIEQLTGIILRQAARACVASREQGIPMTVAVNICLRMLNDVTMADQLLDIVRSEGATPEDIVFEVTESAAATNLGRELENLTRLRMFGFGLSIDDYGTGYSSMQQLTRIPFTELKIDQSFVAQAATQPSARVILESSLAMARTLGLKSVAEGVETQNDFDLLRGLGCDSVQGYLIARPMDVDAFLRWCANRLAMEQPPVPPAPH